MDGKQCSDPKSRVVWSNFTHTWYQPWQCVFKDNKRLIFFHNKRAAEFQRCLCCRIKAGKSEDRKLCLRNKIQHSVKSWKHWTFVHLVTWVANVKLVYVADNCTLLPFQDNQANRMVVKKKKTRRSWRLMCSIWSTLAEAVMKHSSKTYRKSFKSIALTCRECHFRSW